MPKKKEVATTNQGGMSKEMRKAFAQQAIKKADNKANLEHLIHLQELVATNRLDYGDFKALDTRLSAYFNLCKSDAVMPTISGLAMSLCIRREELLKWVNGKTQYPNRDLVSQYFAMLEVYDDVASKDGRIPTMLHIFNAKNNYGYKDKVEISTGDDEEISDEEIEKRYREMHEIVNDEEDN